MKFEYLLDNTPQVVEENNIEEFITKNPQAKFIKEIDELGKKPPSLEDITGAPAEEKSTASKLGVYSPDLLYSDVFNPLAEITVKDRKTQYIKDLEDFERGAKILPLQTQNFSNALIASNTEEVIKPYSDIIADYYDLDESKQNEIFSKRFDLLNKNDKAINAIQNKIIQDEITAFKSSKQNQPKLVSFIDKFNNSEQGKKLTDYEKTYGKNLDNLELQNNSDRIILNDYNFLITEKIRGIKLAQEEDFKNNEEAIINNINTKFQNSKELDLLYKRNAENVQKNISAEVLKENRKKLGLKENPGFIDRISEMVQSGELQVGLGLKSFEIQQVGGKLEELAEQLDNIKDKEDDEVVNVLIDGAVSKRTVKNAKEVISKKQTDLAVDLAKLVPVQKDLEQTLSYFNQNEVNDFYDFVTTSPEAFAQMVPQIITGLVTLSTSIYMQEAGNNYVNQINDYLEKNNLELNEENFIEATKKGVGEKAVSDAVGLINAGLEGVPIFKTLKLFRPAIQNTLLKTLKEAGRQVIRGPGKVGIIPFIDAAVEGSQGLVNDLGRGFVQGDIYQYVDFKNYTQDAIAGGQASGFGLLGGLSISGGLNTAFNETQNKSKVEVSKLISDTKSNIQKDFTDGLISEEEYNIALSNINKFDNINRQIPKNIQGADRIQVAQLIEQKNKFEQEKKSLDPNLTEEIDGQIAEINNEIKSIADKALTLIPEPTETISQKNKKIAAKNEELITVVKDENSKPIEIDKAKNELVANNLGLINDIVNKNFDPTKDTTLTREDLEAEVLLAFSNLINTYKPESNVPFGAYVKQTLPRRLPAMFDKLVETKITDEGKKEIIAKQDVTEIQIEDTVEQAEIDQPTINKLKTELNLDDATVNKVVDAVKKVFGTSLPAVTDKNFKKKVIEGFTNELTDLIKTDGIFGKDSVEYANFIKENAGAIYNSLPLEVMTKRFLPFVEKQLDPITGKPIREATKVGKEVFKKKDFVDIKDDFINYFISRDLGSSTRSDRKTSIAKQIADQLARDEVVDVLLDPEVSEKFKQIQEIEGKEVPDNFIERAIRELDRGLEFLNKLQQNNTLRFSLIVPEIAIAAAKLVLKTIKASLKAGDGLANAIGLAIKAVQEKYGNAEINPDIEKAIRRNISRQKEGIKINEEGLQSDLEDIFTGDMKTVMKLGRDKNGKLITLTSLFKNKKEIEATTKVLNNFIKKLEKENPDINVAQLFDIFGKQTFGSRTKLKGNPSIFNPNEYNKWFKETFPNYKKPKKLKYKSTRKDKIDKNFDFTEDKLRATDALFLYKEIAKDVLQNADPKQAAMILTMTRENESSLLKLAAPILYYQDNLKKDAKTKLEHLSQAAYINTMMINKYRYNKNIDIDKILSDYAVAVIDEKLANTLDSSEIGLKTNQSIEYENGKNHPTKRIFNEKIKALGKYDTVSIRNIETNEVFSFNENIIKEQKNELSNEFNQILEETKGIDKDEVFSEAQGRNMGRRANKLKIFVPYSAEDLLGLLYRFAGKGKQGDQHLKWIKDNITTPLTESYIRFEMNQQASSKFLEEAKKLIKDSGIDLNKEVYKGYTNDQIIRIHLWSTTGYNLEKLIGMKPDQVQEINKFIRQNYGQLQFLDDLKKVYFNNENKYPEPDKEWITGTLTTDLLNFTNTITRAEAFKPFYDNIEAIFGSFDKQKGRLSGDNLNKAKALYGTDFIKALESSLYRISTGKNRSYQLDQQGNTILNWMNNSIGTIMFFNTRSALLQTISNINFTNWTDNNPFMMAKTWSNQPQFWKDFTFLFNSDYLKARRGGLKTDINEQEIADAAAKSDKKVAAVIATILKKGFLPTQYADSFAIALGGASFYRNRVNSYKNNGLSQQEAETEAFKDFREISEETQQSSRPDKISMEQAGFAGRLILAFQNTPMQYNRLAKKAGLDLINGRGDIKTNISKIIFYLGIQNAVFYSLQQALFAIYFDEEEDEKKKTKTDKERYFDVANGMADSILRGSGVYGALISTLKNATIETIEQTKKKNPQYINTIKELSGISPPLNSKFRKLLSIDRRFRYKQELEKMRTMGLETKNPAVLSAADALSVGFNLPADRVLRKINNLRTALEEETQLWQSIALSMGYSTYDVGISEFKSSSTSPETKGLKKKKIKKKTIKKK
jgi:hypothetical protein